jgi:hypothetical protein
VSEWPEPTPDPSEPPRWQGIAALAAAGAAIILLAANGSNWFAAPRMPQIEMPKIELPDLDLRGRSEEEAPVAPDAVQSAATAPVVDATGGQVIQSIPFEACLSAIAENERGLSQEPILLENTPDRRVAVFKFMQGDLTVVCSRADETMTIARREQAP